MTQQFTASEVRGQIAWLRNVTVVGTKTTYQMLNAFADLLEAREKAVPVGMLRIEADPSNQYGKTATFHYADACMDLSLGDHEMFPHPAPHKGATHCDNCGCTWLDDGNNPIGCPYCKPTSSDSERLAEALRQIAREPRKPWPDPFGHSHEAFARAVHATWCDMNRIARAALATHCAQAQPPAASVPGVSAQAHENAQAALAAQENPNG